MIYVEYANEDIMTMKRIHSLHHSESKINNLLTL